MRPPAALSSQSAVLRKGYLVGHADKVTGRVENRRSDCSLPVASWLAFAWPPQSGLAWLCFLFPLIEPDRRVSRIRLSEKTHVFAHGRLLARLGKQTKPNTS